VHGGLHVLPQGVHLVRAQDVQRQPCPGAAVGSGAAGDGQQAGPADGQSEVQRGDRIIGQQVRAALPTKELIAGVRLTCCHVEAADQVEPAHCVSALSYGPAVSRDQRARLRALRRRLPASDCSCPATPDICGGQAVWERVEVITTDV
jgi:hypothetical protein